MSVSPSVCSPIERRIIYGSILYVSTRTSYLLFYGFQWVIDPTPNHSEGPSPVGTRRTPYSLSLFPDVYLHPTSDFPEVFQIVNPPGTIVITPVNFPHHPHLRSNSSDILTFPSFLLGNLKRKLF